MTKTQIQLSEAFLKEIREFAEAREWSLAETFRRGAELLLQVYAKEAPARADWAPPTSRKVGWKGLSAAQLRDAAFDDGDPLVGDAVD